MVFPGAVHIAVAQAHGHKTWELVPDLIRSFLQKLLGFRVGGVQVEGAFFLVRRSVPAVDSGGGRVHYPSAAAFRHFPEELDGAVEVAVEHLPAVHVPGVVHGGLVEQNVDVPYTGPVDPGQPGIKPFTGELRKGLL